MGDSVRPVLLFEGQREFQSFWKELMRKNLRILFLVQTVALLLCSCGKRSEQGGQVPGQIGGTGFVTVTESQFLDPSGSTLLLHGIDVVNKSKEQAYTRGLGPADFASIRSWGMNCIRFGILWDGLEPEPGKLNEDYLDRISQCIQCPCPESQTLLSPHQIRRALQLGVEPTAHAS